MNKRWWKGVQTVLALALVLVLGSCELLFKPEGGNSVSMYAVDSKNGSIYEIDTQTKEASQSALVSIGQNSAGEMRVHNAKAFVAVGSYQNDSPGLYWFDLSAELPVASRIGEKISAQYLCIVSDNLAYVTSADYFSTYQNTVFPFDPSNPAAGLGSAVTGFALGFYPQDIAWVEAGSGAGRVFVADNGNGKVYRLTADGTAVDKVFSMHAQGTTGLLPGLYDADGDGERDRGVFVANTGGFDASWNQLPGSVDFIPLEAASDAQVVTVQNGLSASRLAAFDENVLVATSYGHTWIIDLRMAQGSEGRLKEVKNANGESFGSGDVDVYQGMAYVPDGSQKVYCFPANGVVTSISVGQTGEMITNVAVR